MITTYIFEGYGTNGVYGLGVDAESIEEAIELLEEKLDSLEGAFGILEVDGNPLCVCGICGKEEGKDDNGTR